MTVKVSDRGQNKFQAIIDAREVAVHTLRITANPKVFNPVMRSAITDDIIITAENIFLYAYQANDVLVNSKETASLRLSFQDMAISSATRLLALMSIARPLFHLDKGKIEYWAGLTIKTRTLLRNWKQSDEKRYAQFRV